MKSRLTSRAPDSQVQISARPLGGHIYAAPPFVRWMFLFPIMKEWENARTARDYTMHFAVLSHEKGRGIIPLIQGRIPRQLPWYNITKFRGIIPWFFSPCRCWASCANRRCESVWISTRFLRSRAQRRSATFESRANAVVNITRRCDFDGLTSIHPNVETPK